MRRPDATVPKASVLVPAYNEEAVIARTLAPFAPYAASGELEVIVACNGCRDRTAETAAAAAPAARIIETEAAGKTHALNLAEAAASAPICVYLDADLEVDPEDVLWLVMRLEGRGALAACGSMRVDSAASSRAVCAFYRVWSLNPYLRQGKFGGLFALTAEGRRRVHPLPHLTADDEYIRRSFDPAERLTVEDCVFTAHAPRTLADLVRIRRRSLRGARALRRLDLPASEATGARSGLDTLGRLMLRPSLWPAALVYFGVAIWVRLSIVLERPETAARWERDESSRRPPVAARA